MKRAWLGVALTYVGAVVGAGFASGQEIWQFFGRWGQGGVYGIVCAGFLFLWAGDRALEAGRNRLAASVPQLVATRYPPWVKTTTDGLVTVFLWTGLAVVAAGGGATLHDLFTLPEWLGAMITLLVSALVAAKGGEAVIAANSLLIPYLVGLTVVVALLVTRDSGPGLNPGPPAGHWALSAILYVSYNIFTGIVVLLPMGPRLQTRRESFLAAAAGAILLSSLAMMEHRVLGRLPHISALPMLTAAHLVHPMLGRLYAVSLWIALLTTGVGELYGLHLRYKRRLWPWLLPTLILGGYGFQSLIATLYPVMGLISLGLWLPLARPRRGGHECGHK